MSTEHIQITSELTDLLDYIQTEITPRYPNVMPTTPHFLLAVIDNRSCTAHDFLINIVFDGKIDRFRQYCIDTLESMDKIINVANPNACMENFVLNAQQIQKECDPTAITSSLHAAMYMVSHDKWLIDFLIGNNITVNDVMQRFEKRQNERNNRLPVVQENSNKPIRHPRTKKDKTNTDNTISGVNVSNAIQQMRVEENILSMCSTPIYQLASQGELEMFVENEVLYTQMFNILSRRSKNNVLVVGDHGVGKTAFVHHLAVKILENTVPKKLQDKKLIELDFNKLLVGTSLRGVFEQKVDELVRYFHSHSEYLLFIDDLGDIIRSMNKTNQADIEPMVKSFLTESRLGVICATSRQTYKSKLEDSQLMRYFQVIDLNEPSEDETSKILDIVKQSLEAHHSVSYDAEIIKQSPKLAKKYIPSRALPDSAIDLLDEMGAMKSNQEKPSAEMIEVQNDLDVLEDVLAGGVEDYDERDEMLRERIKLKSKLANLEKKHNQTKIPDLITMHDLQALVSVKTGVPITNVTAEEKLSLKNLEAKLKEDVIGQDKAVEEVSKAIKRKRVGLTNHDKPSVLFFGGSTGTGKTYLSKMLAKHVFGDERNMVRIDMSEYADKTSVNKILGASAGYIGYENGSMLLDAVKKNKYCVVLLDEIEKADEQIHNTLLQIFDEGRMTDNHGNLVDFRNTIIIMTSNVGAKAIVERGNAVGFTSASVDSSEAIVKKELKRVFKPEFLNRIDKIVYFNKLSDSDLKNIIKCELHKIDLRLCDNGMSLDSDMYDDDMIDWLFDQLDNAKDMGARPVLRMLQQHVEDKIADCIIDNDIEPGYAFHKNMFMEQSKI